MLKKELIAPKISYSARLQAHAQRSPGQVPHFGLSFVQAPVGQ